MYTKVNPFIQGFQALNGFYNPNELYNLRKQSTGSKILYSIIFSIVLAFLICISVIIDINTDKEFENMIKELPNFSYASGSFYLEEPVATASQSSYVIIDTDQNEWDLEILQQQAHGTTTKGYASFQDALDNSAITDILMLSRTNIVSYKKYTGQFTEMSLYEFFSFLGIRTFSKDIILDGYKGFVTKIGLFSTIFVAPYQLSKLFFVSLILSLIGLIINAACASKEKFASVYWISFYIQSVLMILKAIGADFVHINGFLLSCICLVIYIIIMIRTLKRGDISARPVMIYNSDEDLDFYLQQQYTIPETTTTTTSESSVTPNSYTQEVFPNKPQEEQPEENVVTTSSTGLSLKIDE